MLKPREQILLRTILKRLQAGHIDEINIPFQEDKSHENIGRYIRIQLGGHAYLEDWQEANGWGIRTVEQAKEDRIKWIKWMIGELN